MSQAAAPLPPDPELRHRRMHGEDRRKELLRAAIESFARNGFSGTKTKDIAAAAGVSEAILFRHFASKEDLYHAILDAKEQSGTDRWSEIRALADQRDDAGLFRCLASQITDAFRRDAAFQRLLLYAALEGHLLASLFQKRFGLPAKDFLRGYIVLRQQEGAFRQCDASAAVMFVMSAPLQYAMSRHLFGAKKPSAREDEEMVEQISAFILRGLQSAPKRQTEQPSGKRPRTRQ